jgi:hypothetical protein
MLDPEAMRRIIEYNMQVTMFHLEEDEEAGKDDNDGKDLNDDLIQKPNNDENHDENQNNFNLKKPLGPSKTKPPLPATSYDMQNFVPGFNFPMPYAFDYYAMWQDISTYIRYSGDVGFLDNFEFDISYVGDEYEKRNRTRPIKTRMTTFEYLIELATSYAKLPHIPNTDGLIADYGGNLRSFLEVIPTYIHAVPAMTYSNVLMLLGLSEIVKLRREFGVPNPEDAFYDLDPAQLKADGFKMLGLANALMYNGDGTFKSL